MTLCSSGSLSIKTTAGTNRSISTEVGTGSGSLSALSVSAGKSAPHCMREFYGYSNIIYTSMDLVTINCSQGAVAGNWLACINGDSCSDSCYDLTVYWTTKASYHLKTTGTACLICNGICKYGHTSVGGEVDSGDWGSFRVNASDCVCFCTDAGGFVIGSSAYASMCIKTIGWVAGSSTCYSRGTHYQIFSSGGDT